jgi:peptidoglycan hydrolase-like protein with peptidoglycan-binding domain
MNRLLVVSLSLSVLLVSASATRAHARTSLAQDDARVRAGGAQATKRRGPVFRATKEQIRQAQTMLRQRGFYSGETTGKLDAETRSGLRKYQEAEGLKVTGTLNRVTLEKMSITLTDRQKATPAA